MEVSQRLITAASMIIVLMFFAARIRVLPYPVLYGDSIGGLCVTELPDFRS